MTLTANNKGDYHSFPLPSSSSLTLLLAVEAGLLRAGEALPPNWPESCTPYSRTLATTQARNDVALQLFDEYKPYQLQWLLWKAASHFGFSYYQHPYTNDVISVRPIKGFTAEKPSAARPPSSETAPAVDKSDLYPFSSRWHPPAVPQPPEAGPAASRLVHLERCRRSSNSSSTSLSSAASSEDRLSISVSIPSAKIESPSPSVSSHVQKGYSLTVPFSVSELPSEKSREILNLPSYAQAHQMNLEANSRWRTCYKDPVTGCLVLTSGFLSQFSNCGGEFCKHCPHGGVCRREFYIMLNDSEEDSSLEEGWSSSSGDSSVLAAVLDFASDDDKL